MEDELDKLARKLRQLDFNKVNVGSTNFNWGTEEFHNDIRERMLKQGWTPEEYVKEAESRPYKQPQQILTMLRCRKSQPVERTIRKS